MAKKKKPNPGTGNAPGTGVSPELWDRGNTSGGDRARSAEFLAGRRAMAREMASSGGMTQTQLGAEILYLLPDDFVEFYEQLWHAALSDGQESVMHGRSGGLEKAKGEGGMVLGSTTKLQAQPAGKKWTAPRTPLGSTDMLKVKDSVDKGLKELISDARRSLAMMREQRDQGPGALIKSRTSQCSGVKVFLGAVSVDEMGRQLTEPDRRVSCGKFLKANWSYCPACGTRVDNARSTDGDTDTG